MSEHTPGRIQLAKEFDGHIMTTDGLAVADCCLDYSSLDHDQQVSNARRLVACWNACEMVSTEDLEALTRPGDVSWAATIDRLVRERDGLLAALQEADKDFEREGFGEESPYRAPIRAAIAKVKGGAA